MLSPSPTQPPPVQTAPVPALPEPKQVKLTPARRRAGQAPLARAIKAIFRPILKLLYYIIRWIRAHKLATLLAILLLVGSIFLTSYFVTKTMPFFGPDQVEKSVKGNPQLSPDVKAWILALRSGDVGTMKALDKGVITTQPPDDASYVLEFSEQQAQTKWTAVKLLGINTSTDGVVETFLEVDFTAPASAGGGNIVTFWHFTTAPSGRILALNFDTGRQSIR